MDKSILEVVHDGAKDLHKAGLVDAVTMREFDSLCLPPIRKFTAAQIKSLRLRTKTSQGVFAAYLIPAKQPSRNGSKEQNAQTDHH